MKILKFLKIEFNNDRIYGLDILRAVAILFVILPHGSLLLPDYIRKTHKYFMFDGVSIFFVLSGFLIGKILIKHLKEGIVTFKTIFSFWSKRWLRTLPAYYFTLILLITMDFIKTNDFTFREIVWKTKRYFIFLQNFDSPHPPFFPEAWSLSIEEWFYLLIPFILFILIRYLHFSVKRSIVIAALLIIFLTIEFRFLRYLNSYIFITSSEHWDLIFRKQVVTRLDSLMFGIIGAYWAFYQKNSWIKLKSICFVCGLVIIIAQNILNSTELLKYGLYNCVFSFTTTSFGVLLLLPYLSELTSGSGFFYKATTYLALLSYSMYLLNLSFIQRNILDMFKLNFLAKFHLVSITSYFLYMFMITFGALLMYKYIEKPFMDMRKKISRN